MESNQYIPALGPIAAALIAGFITFFITVLSKEQKTSEFRQSWIDALRNDIAELIGLLGVTFSLVRNQLEREVSKEELLKHLYEKEANFVKIETLISAIKLRANPKEHATFIAALERLADLSHDVSELRNRKACSDAEDEFLQESQRLLKAEWQRVKRGEPVFKFAKWLSLVMFFVSLVGAIALAFHLGK